MPKSMETGKNNDPLSPEYKLFTINGDFVNHDYKREQGKQSPEMITTILTLINRINNLEKSESYNKLSSIEKARLNEIKTKLEEHKRKSESKNMLSKL